jgi:hypothetical protein
VSPRLSRIAVRALVAICVMIAAVIAVVAFMPGTEVPSPYGMEIRQAGGMRVAVLAIAAVFPGLVAWIAPRPPVLWLWTAIALVVSLLLYGLLENVNSPRAHLVWWPAPAVEAAVWALAVSTVLGSYIAGFAVDASEARYGGEAPELAARLRKLITGLAVLAVVLIGVGLLPGQRVYHDANHCLGRALAALHLAEPSCTSSYTDLRGTYPAGGLRLALYLVVVLVPAWPLYRDPRAPRAWKWFAASIAAGIIAGNLVFYLEVEPDALSHTVTLWPARIVEAGVAAIQVVLLLALPLTIARSRTPRVPTARVVARP